MILSGLALFIHAYSRVLTKTFLAAGIAFPLILPGLALTIHAQSLSLTNALSAAGIAYSLILAYLVALFLFGALHLLVALCFPCATLPIHDADHARGGCICAGG